ncbi:hypothetical protein J6590_027433 [Homalodisca vitripennis]|nr:hypothetical protein J6590_027433 [Homalodisca vitripennis]
MNTLSTNHRSTIFSAVSGGDRMLRVQRPYIMTLSGPTPSASLPVSSVLIKQQACYNLSTRARGRRSRNKLKHVGVVL